VPAQVDVLDFQPDRLAEAQSRTVEDQDKDTHGGARTATAAEAGSFIEERANLFYREDVGKEIGFRRLGCPLASGDETIGIEAASVSEELSQGAQIHRDRNRLSIFTPA
jgi:hypothetical protein